MAQASSAALGLHIGEDGIAVLTFDLPGSRANTLGQPIQAEFEQVLAELRGRTDVRGLILRSGKPGMFIAGADLKELGASNATPDMMRKLTARGLNIIAAFEELPFPTVALIDGACMGGGTEFALGFDYRLAGSHPKTEIGLPETKIGIIPGWGGTQRLTRLIGPALAAELICPGDAVNAQRRASCTSSSTRCRANASRTRRCGSSTGPSTAATGRSCAGASGNRSVSPRRS